MKTRILQDIIDTSHDLIAAIDCEFNFLAFNRAYREEFAKVFGCDPIVGQKLPPWPTEREVIQQSWTRALDGQACEMEIELGPPGQRKLFQIAFTPLWDEHNTIIGASHIARDISDRAQAEGHIRRLNQELLRRVAEQNSALRQSEQRFRATFESAPVGIAHLDFSGNWLVMNQRMAEITGYTCEELRQTTFQAITHPDDIKDDIAHARRLAAGEIDRYEVEKRYIRKDGSVVWVMLTGGIVRGDPPYFIAVVEDITERKAADEALRTATAEAERASKAKSRFLAAASHDLRQPAQSLALFASVLEQRLAGTAEAEVVDRLVQSIDGLRMLLDSMLDISKLDAGLIMPQIVPVPIGDLLSRMASEYALQLEASEVRLRYVPTSVQVLTDPALIERIVRNLITNSIRYTERGGILIGCRHQGGQVRIEVVDSGIGIPPEHMDSVFEEFHQVGNPARDRRQGLGLGLAIVNRLARLLGHEFRLHSRLGNGTRFSLSLPLARPSVIEQPAPAVTASGPGRVIVVDDEELVRSGLALMLEGWGFEVVTAADGDGAEHALNAMSPDAIIADYRLARGEIGTQVIERLRLAAGRPIPALVLTGDTAPERIAEAARSGISTLHKPVSSEQLRAAISRLIAT